jgi:diacylglycerol kinase family enzyme
VRALLIYNPSAGEGFDPAPAVSLLERAGYAVQARSLKDDGWEGALGSDAHLVVAAGGDGAVASVFTRLAGGRSTAALLPAGSANNIATALGYEDADPLLQLDRVLAAGTPAPFDIGSLAGTTTRFVESAGAGIFAEMLVRAEELRDEQGESKVAQGLRLLLEIVRDVPPRPWQVHVDGETLYGDYIAAEASNIGLIGPNIPLVPRADPGDGLLDLVLLRAEDERQLIRHAEARLKDGSPPALELDVRRARRVELVPPAGCATHVDDELVEAPGEKLTMTAETALTVLRPPRR